MPKFGYPSAPGTRKERWCLCPRCGRKHKKTIFFTGKGTPKKFCRLCNRQIDEQETETLNCFGYQEIAPRFSEMEIPI